MKYIKITLLAFFFSFGGILFSANISFAEGESTVPAEASSAGENCANYFPSAEEDEYTENKYCDLIQTIMEQDLSAQEKTNVEIAFEKVKEQYHKETNDYLNEKVSKLQGTTFQCDVKREDTSGMTNIKEVYTVRKLELKRYKAALQTIIDTYIPENPPIQTGEPLEIAFGKIDMFSKMVAHEYEISGRVLTLAIQNYSEMRKMYPLHKELECLIEDLEELRDMWGLIVRQVSRMPAKFINASSK